MQVWGVQFYLFIFSTPDITVNQLAEGIKVICPDSYEPKEIALEKRDNNTMEYTCKKSETEKLKIYVKFRSKLYLWNVMKKTSVFHFIVPSMHTLLYLFYLASFFIIM